MNQDVHSKKKLNLGAIRLPVRELADRRFFAPFLLALGPILPGILLWRFFPDEIATHFNLIGEPNGYAPRAFVVFGLPVLFALVDLLIMLAVHFDDDAERKLGSREVMLYLWIVPVVSWSICLLLDLKAVNVNVNIRAWTEIIAGTFLILLSFLIFRIPYQPSYGIRTPWTPESETNWQMTNKVSAWVYRGIGIFALADGFFHFIQFNGWFVIILAIIFTPIGVSYYEHRMDMKERKEAEKGDPQEDLKGAEIFERELEKEIEEDEEIPDEEEAFFEKEAQELFDDTVEDDLFRMEKAEAELPDEEDDIFEAELPEDEEDLFREEDIFKKEDSDIFQGEGNIFRKESLGQEIHSRANEEVRR